MSFDAKVFRILVASPGDVHEERDVIPQIIDEWNVVNAASTKVVLMPVKWETHSAPLLGDRPQGIINQQIVKECDLLVGIFWTRIGTNTGVAISGTAEEIEQFVESKRPVMLYFSKSPIDPDRIDLDQFTILKTFKDKMRLQGLTDSYDSISDFKNKFSRQLSINVAHIINEALQNDVSSSPLTKPTRKSQKSDKVNNKGSLSDATIEATTIHPAPVEKEKLSPQKIDEYLKKSVISSSDSNGWAKMAAIGAYLQTYTPINYKELGYTKLLDFLKSRKLFEFETVNDHPIVKIAPKKVAE